MTKINPYDLPEANKLGIIEVTLDNIQWDEELQLSPRRTMTIKVPASTEEIKIVSTAIETASIIMGGASIVDCDVLPF
jgi:hypothetical protein